MAKFKEEVGGALERSGELWQEAGRLLKLGVIDQEFSSANGEDHFRATNSVVPAEILHLDRYETLDEDLEVLSKHYRIGARVKGRHIHPNDPVYLIVNDNFSTAHLLFQSNSPGLIEIGGEISAVEDSEKYVPFIFKAIAQDIETHKKELQSRREHKKHRIKQWVGGITVAGTMAGAAILGTPRIVEWKHERDAREAVETAAKTKAKRDAILNFDLAFPTLDVAPVKVDQVTLASASKKFVDVAVPKFADDDNDVKDLSRKLSSPRYFDVPSKDECDTYDVPIDSTDRISAVQDGDPLDNIVVYASSSNDKIKVCNKGTFSDSDKVKATHVFIELTK